MSRLISFTFLVSMLAFAAHAAPMNVLPGDNMVSLPAETMVAVPDNAPLEENMVYIKDDVEGIYVPITGPSYVEAGVNYHDVSNGQGNWFGQFINGQVQTDPKNRWSGGIMHQEAFHDDGYFVNVGNNHIFDEKWFTNVGVGMGTDTSFLPRFRADADVNRRWLEGGNLISTLGVTFTAANETYTGYGLYLGASYYFNAPWVIQGGVRIDMSNPGQVFGNSEFIAVTYGHQKNYYFTLKAGIAHEAYQLLGGGNSINSEFNSHNFGANWRHWLGADWGYNLAGEYYKNPFYWRNGVIISVFKEF